MWLKGTTAVPFLLISLSGEDMIGKPLFTESMHGADSIEHIMTVLSNIAPELKLSTYPVRFDILSFDQIFDAYHSFGLPINYRHWSFGKNLIQEKNLYKHRKHSLILEVVLNANPCINFLMADNTPVAQAMVIAHAAFGHNHVFKNNYMFRQWTDAENIVDYLNFAKEYITYCENRYGSNDTATTVRAAYSLINYGVDREHSFRQSNKELADINNSSHLTKNLLYFLELNSPVLNTWQREILRISRNLSQYFEPQRATRVLNEGWASFTHYYMMTRLHDEGYLTDHNMIEFYQLHSSLLYQPPFDNRYHNGINPYYLGFEIFNDIKRMCTEPSIEDENYFPEVVNRHWVDACTDAIISYHDESLIRQWLSPALYRKLRVFLLNDNSPTGHNSIYTNEIYQETKSALANSYLVENCFPKIELIDTKQPILKYYYKNTAGNIDPIIKSFEILWGSTVSVKKEKI